MVTEDTFIVICLDADVTKGGYQYVLATRQVFWTHEEAAAYAATVATSRDPLVVAGRFTELRFPEPA